jgi:hypothetical protein
MTALSEPSPMAKRHPVASFSRGHRSFARRVLTGESNRAPDAGRITADVETVHDERASVDGDQGRISWLDKSPKGPRR